MFTDLANQLAELDGKIIDEKEKITDTELSKNIKAGDKEESLSIELDKQTLLLHHSNITSEIVVSFYEIDLEVLFSRSPFISQNRSEFEYTKANYVEKIDNLKI